MKTKYNRDPRKWYDKLFQLHEMGEWIGRVARFLHFFWIYRIGGEGKQLSGEIDKLMEESC